MASLRPYRHVISFGDCDPAGIVFYPNIFRWMDAAFHQTLNEFGGHAAICDRLGAIGLGLMDATCAFRAPMHNGDTVDLRPTITRWGGKSLTVDYEGVVGERVTITGREVRGVFIETDGGLTAGGMAGLRAIFAEAGYP